MADRYFSEGSIGARFAKWIVAALVLAATAPALANSCTSAGGNWGTAGTWSNCGGTIPQNGDSVTITAGTVNVNVATIPATGSLTSITMTGGTMSWTGVGANNPATVTVSGSVTMSNAAVMSVPGTNNLHTFNVGGDITASNTSSMDLFNTANRLVNLNLTNTTLATIGGTSTGALQLNNVTSSANLTVSRTGATVDLRGSLTVGSASTHDLTIPTGTTLSVVGTEDVFGATSVTGTFTHATTAANNRRYRGTVTINPGGVWTNSANAAVFFQNGVTHDGTTFTAGTGAYTFELGQASQTIGGSVALALPSISISAGVNVTNDNSSGLTIATSMGAGTGTFTNGANRQVTIGFAGPPTPTIDATASGNTVNYSSGAAQTIKATTYDTLNFIGAGAKSNTGTTTVNTALTGTNLTNSATGTLNIGGTSTLTTLTATAAGNVVNYTGSGQTVKATTYVTLNVNGTATNSGTVTVNTTLGGSGTLTNTGTLNIAAASTISTLDASTNPNTVNYTGGAAQTVFPTTYDTLNFSGGGVKTNSGVTTVNTALTGTALTNAATGTLNIGGTSTLTTLTATAVGNTVVYNGGTAQTVKSTTYHHLTLNNAAGTTLGGAITVNGNLNIAAGTLSDNGSQITGNATGTLTVASSAGLKLGNGAANTTFPNFVDANIKLDAASTVTYNSTGAQTVRGLTVANCSSPTTVPCYGNLTISKTAGVGTLGAATTVAGALVITSGTLNTSAASNFALSVSGSITGAGTLTGNTSAISVGGDMTVSTFNAGAAPSTVTFNGTGAQQVGGVYTFRHLTINKSAGTATLGGATTVSGNLTITSGTLADGGFQLTGNGTGTMSMASGTALTLGTSTNTLFPTNFTNANITLTAGVTPSTVTYQSTGAQTVSGVPTYANLVIDKASTTGTLGAATTVAGSLTISAGTLDTSSVSNFSLSVTDGITGAGGLTGNASAIGVGGDMTVTTFTAGTSTVTFNGSGAQAVGGAYTFNNLVINKPAGTATQGGSTSVGGNLTITAGTLSTSGSGFNLSVTGNITGGGTLSGNSSAIGVGGNMTVTTFSAGTSTVQFNGTGAQTVGGAYSFSSLSINKSSGTATLGGATSVSGNLTLTAGTLDDAGFQITGNGTGTLNMSSGTLLSLGTAGTATAFPTAFTAGNTTLNAGSTVTYASGAAQTVSTTPTYGNLTFSGAGTKTTASGTLTVAGDLTSGSTTSFTTNNTSTTLTGSSKSIAGGTSITFTTLTVNGSYSNSSTGTITVNTALSGSGTLAQGTNALLTLKGTAGISTLTATANPNTVTYNGSSAQAAKATTYHHLTIDNSAGVAQGSVTLASGNATVNGTLTLTNGNVCAGTVSGTCDYSRTLIIASTGSVSRTSGHIIGNLQKNVATGATSRTYEVGDASGYTPMTVAFGNVTVAGDLTVKATAGAHPDLTNSGVDPLQSPTKQSVNRYWTATNSGVTFDNYSATLTYLSGDLDAGLDLTTVGLAKADSCAPPCAWSFPTLVGTPTATSAQASGMTGFSDFGVGHRVDHFVFTAPANATQNTAFSVTITAVDKNGNTVNGFTGTATLTSTNGNCTISAGGTTAAFASGSYTGNVTISNACSDTLKATMVGNSGVTGTSGTVAVAATVSSFNAFETSTAANATTGQIYTKLVATGPFGLDVVAINSGAQATGFSGNVKVELLANATPGSNYGADNCPTSNSVVQTIASFAVSGGRSTASLSAVATAYRDVRVRVSYPTSSPTVTTCSTDSFSIRPGNFTISTTTATNTGTSGAPAIKTGASFDLSAASSAGYNTLPSIDNSSGMVAGTPNAGTIAGSFTSVSAGTATGSAFTYSEVGNFGLSANAVYDSTFTSIDQPNDCTNDFSTTLVGGKYGCKIGSSATGASAFGRFIPDNFNVSLNAPTLAASCGTFSYVGQTFVFGTAPTITVTARNGTALGNATTQNYAGAYVKLTNSTLTPGTQAGRYSRFDALGGGATPALGMTSGFPDTTTDPAIGAFTNGVGTLTFGTGASGPPPEGFLFTRSTTTPNAPFNADIALQINIIDGDSVVYASNPIVFGAATADNGISFAGGKTIRFGRLRILPATGVANLPLDVAIRAEHWTGSGFATNTLDSCTQIARANVKQSAYKAPLAACDTRISTTPVTLSSGAGTLRLSAPSGGHAGSLTLTPQLGGIAGTFCDTVGGGTSSTSSAGLSHLLGKWDGSANYDKDPSARAAFGVYGSQPRNFIFFRENY